MKKKKKKKKKGKILVLKNYNWWCRGERPTGNWKIGGNNGRTAMGG